MPAPNSEMADAWFDAARRGDGEYIRLHLSSSAGSKDSQGRTALMHAAESGAIGIISFLLPEEKLLTDNTDNCALSLAILAGNLEAAKALVYSEFAFRYRDGRDCLMLAAEIADFNMVSLLTQYVEKNVDTYGQTALSFAVRRGDTDIIKCLLQRFSFTEQELLGALHNFSGPNFVETSSLIYLQNHRLKSELCCNCQALTTKVLSLEQEIRRLQNILQMEQMQSGALHAKIQNLAEKLKCPKDNVFQKIEQMLCYFFTIPGGLFKISAEFFNHEDLNGNLEDLPLSTVKDLEQLNKYIFNAVEKHCQQSFILRQQIETLKNEKDILCRKLSTSGQTRETLSAVIKAKEQELADTINVNKDLNTKLSLQEDELKSSNDMISSLKMQNCELTRQLDVLLHEDAKITKDGITPLMKSILLGEFDVAMGFVEKYARKKSAEGLTALHMLLQSKRLCPMPISVKGYSTLLSKEKGEQKSVGLVDMHMHASVVEKDKATHDRHQDTYVLSYREVPIDQHVTTSPRSPRGDTTQVSDSSITLEPFFNARVPLRFMNCQLQLEVPIPYFDTTINANLEPMLSPTDTSAVSLFRQLAEIEADLKNTNNETALELAMNDRNIFAIDILAPHQAHIITSKGNLPIFEAIKIAADYPQGHQDANREERARATTVCKILLSHSSGLCSDEGTTPLMMAAQQNIQEIASLLMETEARKQNFYGDTALMIAVACGHTQIVQDLAPLEAGIINNDGMSALILAIHLQREAELRILLPYELTTLSRQGEHPLLAVLHTHNARLSYLLIEELIVKVREVSGVDSLAETLLDKIQEDVLSFKFSSAIARAISWCHSWRAFHEADNQSTVSE
ncbi:Ankyrin repeat protein [Giardia duodenalis]|uniref:Ankyrin repeat protein n=1 Tax=Giardia intestinalis TaxID=5741 RepID=V6TZ84_GIAIN|nr:Ankyrin repeat protein [Giardia intestinalis]